MPALRDGALPQTAARGLGWWVQVSSGEPAPRFLVAPLLGMTVLMQGPETGLDVRHNLLRIALKHRDSQLDINDTSE